MLQSTIAATQRDTETVRFEILSNKVKIILQTSHWKHWENVIYHENTKQYRFHSVFHTMKRSKNNDKSFP